VKALHQIKGIVVMFRLNPNAEYGNEKIQIEVETSCDTRRLYGSFDEAIAYLNELKQICPTGNLSEIWTGYEDMEMSYVFSREETDTEFETRLENERRLRAQRQGETARAEQRSRDIAELGRLKQKLGM
jgi:hypothetical protein